MKEKKNNALAEIVSALMDANTVLIFPHISMDGDAMGSSAALCAALRKAGKTAHVVVEEELPDMVAFLDRGYCTENPALPGRPDVCVCVDCGEYRRFPKRKALFLSGALSICVDHHKTTTPFLDLNYIDGAAAATAEIMYDLISLMGVGIDAEIGGALYAGIVTDTGKFQYSNTTRKTHLIAAELHAVGVRAAEISILLYQNERMEKRLMESRILGEAELFAGGRAVISCITRKMLEETGGRLDETDGVTEMLRDIRGVELACLLKEKSPRTIKVSLRSKRDFDVAAFSEENGGGGHVRAAGFTAKGRSVEAVKAKLMRELEERLSCVAQPGK
ncbi:MAG: bifunctional oligoribonuclease/PAP phosphatase NrnA [Clostridiales Family XIII bacterium]|jgi:phosphoesterase RecJ-like protein|nr:bifunctional oligoribonuclease/PAP phosphatase NrnA [Clostridiales Family XIII bacterium]